MGTKDALSKAIAGFDGRASTPLTEAKAALGGRADFHRAAVALADDGDAAVSSGATWLIKHELEAGWAMPAGLARALTARLGGVTDDWAMLHLCQSARLMPLAGTDLGIWRDWLAPLLSHDRPFLRAWSLDALCRLGELESAYQAEADGHLARMASDPAASVRARARRLEKARARR